MKKTFRVAVIPAVLAALCSCMRDDLPRGASPTRARPAALSAPGLTPVPYDWASETPLWKGDTVELLFLDAMAGCSTLRAASGVTSSRLAMNDEYAKMVESRSWGMACPGHVEPSEGDPIVLLRWADIREDKECNKDPSTEQKRAAPITLTPVLSEVKVLDNGVATQQERDYALADIVGPSTNLCIAQRLRRVSPGASGGEAILLSEAEQRELLAVTQERAQRAMLGLAMLGVEFMPDTFNSLDVDQRVKLVKDWAAEPSNASFVKSLGTDLIAAAELHTIVSTELANLLARSGSARSVRGGTPATDAEETWGKASWRQRVLASLFGGIPLAAESDGSSPWREPTGKTSMSLWFHSGWPDSRLFPYARYQIRRPETHQFAAVAGVIPMHRIMLQSATPGLCSRVDTNATGIALYSEVELALQRQACLNLDTTTSPPVCVAQLPAAQADYLLWKRYRVRAEDAIGYAELVADQLEPICRDADNAAQWPAATANLIGAMQLDATGDAVLLASNSVRDAKSLVQRVSQFTRANEWRMPVEVYSAAHAPDQGLPNYVTAESSQAYAYLGHVGSLSALVAVREALHSMAVHASESADAKTVYETFVTHGEKFVDYISAGSGQRSVSLRPQLVPSEKGFDLDPLMVGDAHAFRVDIVNPASDTWWSSADGSSFMVVPVLNEPYAGNLAQVPASRIFGRTIQTLVEPIVNVPDGTWGAAYEDTLEAESKAGLRRHRAQVRMTRDECPDPLGCSGWPNGNRYTLVARKRDPMGAIDYRLLVADINPQFTTHDGQYVGHGGTLGAIAEQSLMPDQQNPAQPKYDGFGLPTRWIPPVDPVLYGAAPGESAVAHRLDMAQQAAEEATWAVEAAMEALLQQQADEQDLGAAQKQAETMNRLEEGSLCGDANTKCAEGIKTSPQPVLVRDPEWFPGVNHDGTMSGRCPTTLDIDVPPVTSFGDEGTKDILESYIDTALGDGVTWDTLDGWLTQFGHSHRRFVDPILVSFYGFRSSLAGDGEADLNPKLSNEDFANALVLKCQALELLNALTGDPTTGPEGASRVELAQEVLVVRDAVSVPSFSEYSGGSLQSAFILQWKALRNARDLAKEYIKAVDLAVMRVLQAKATQNEAAQTYHASCNPGKANEATRACFSFAIFTPSFNAGPLIAYNQRCLELAAAVGPLMMAAATAQAEANMQVASYASRITDAAAEVQLASANVQQLVQAANYAKKRNDLEKELVSDTLTTTSGLYRRFHSYDLWRAKALVESARRYSVVARRSVEAHFAVDLSLMKGAEPLVAAPSTWADEVYGYDLSLPAAVGLVVGQPTPGGLYSSKIADYVGNLRRFTEGYAVARPSAVAHADTEVLSIPGPYATRQVAKKVNGVETGEFATLPDERAMRWEVFCPNLGAQGAWRQVAFAQESFDPENNQVVIAAPKWRDPPCIPIECESQPESQECLAAPPAVAPTKARVPFYLDPWGRLEDLVGNEPYGARYNARWSQVAVNLVGTAVKDCNKAADPLGCYGESFLRYRLRHTGPAWVTGYDHQWTYFGVPIGVIEGGKALAIEQFLDPLTNCWGKSYVDSAARTEFADRPFGGAYEMEMELGPEVVLKQIERVQILTGASYWVEQN